MDDFITASALDLLDNIRAQSSKTLRLIMLGEALECESAQLALHLAASGVITNKPLMKFNKFTSSHDFNDIIRYFHGDAVGTPYNTLRLLSYIHDPKGFGIERHEIIEALANTGELDVYSVLGTPAVPDSCVACGCSIVGEGLCGSCNDALAAFTDFRSEDSFIADLNSNNFRLHALLTTGKYTFTVGSYQLSIDGKRLMGTRVSPIYDARLPINEFRLSLS